MTTTPYRSAIRPPRTGFGQALRAEWTKFRTVRGWVIGVLVAIGVTVLIGILPPAAGTISCGDRACTPTTPPRGPDGTPVTDTFYFVHQPLTGDGGITVHLAALTGLYPSRGIRPANLGPLAGMSPGTQPWTKGGIIVKQSLTPGSAYAAVLRTGSHGVRMQYDYTHDTAGAATASWLRLVRSGDTLTGYDSADGTHWTEIGTANLPNLPTTVQVGLFAASPDYSVVTQSFGGATSRGGPSFGIAHFDDVSVRGGTGTWTGSAVIDSGRRNAATGDDGYTREANGFTVTASGDIAPAIAGNGVDNTVDVYLVGVFAGLITLIVVATMFVTAEYRRGLIRVTLAATPNRGQVLAAKAVVVGAVAFVAGLVAVALAVPLAGAWWYAKGVAQFPTPTWTEVRVIVGAAALLAVSSVLAVAVGALLRRSAAAVTAVIVAIVLPYVLAVASAVPAGAAEWLTRVTPAAAFSIMQTVVRYPQVDSAYTPADGYFPLSPWSGFAVLCGYAAVALVLAAILLRRRDA